MGAFKYVLCVMFVGIVALIPVIPPVREAIVSVFSSMEIYTSYYVTISFNAEIIPGIMPIAILVIGSFTVYCVYRGHECSWRKERVKQDLFVPSMFDGDTG